MTYCRKCEETFYLLLGCCSASRNILCITLISSLCSTWQSITSCLLGQSDCDVQRFSSSPRWPARTRWGWWRPCSMSWPGTFDTFKPVLIVLFHYFCCHDLVLRRWFPCFIVLILIFLWEQCLKRKLISATYRYTPEQQGALVSNVFLTGGNMLYPGMKERVEKELLAMRPFQSHFKVLQSYPVYYNAL